MVIDIGTTVGSEMVIKGKRMTIERMKIGILHQAAKIQNLEWRLC